mmetsp:Transcript_75042/g.121955  ORF Transcript_75042/g.121955 Transcript_75042/m.121955 type:complete len:103 (-) Transcript_75042:1281-1589(-)
MRKDPNSDVTGERGVVAYPNTPSSVTGVVTRREFSKLAGENSRFSKEDFRGLRGECGPGSVGVKTGMFRRGDAAWVTGDAVCVAWMEGLEGGLGRDSLCSEE